MQEWNKMKNKILDYELSNKIRLKLHWLEKILILCQIGFLVEAIIVFNILFVENTGGFSGCFGPPEFPVILGNLLEIIIATGSISSFMLFILHYSNTIKINSKTLLISPLIQLVSMWIILYLFFG